MRIPVEDVVDPYDIDAEKPHTNNRRKKKPDPVCAIVLQREQSYQYHTCHWKQNICKATEPTVRSNHYSPFSNGHNLGTTGR
jgi:hypothetical protein